VELANSSQFELGSAVKRLCVVKQCDELAEASRIQEGSAVMFSEI
jgi:hypothetical protein